MAFDHWAHKDGPHRLVQAGDELFAPAGMAGRILNMRLTRDNTLRSVVGPAEYHPHVWDSAVSVGTITAPGYGYGSSFDGVHHAVVGDRDILLVVGTLDSGAGGKYGVWEHQGAQRNWRLLLGPDPSATFRADIESSPNKQLFQFVNTPRGIVIIPPAGRAYFYDGFVLLPFGYTRGPSAPTPLSPRLVTGDDGAGALEDQTDAGYHHTGRTMGPAFGDGRLGTIRDNTLDIADVTKKTNPLGGTLLQGAWSAVSQWVDYFDNLSPLSAESAQAICYADENLSKDRNRDEAETSSRLRIQIAWDNISRGPNGTVARIVGRSMDRNNSGDTSYHELPPTISGSLSAKYTLDDNTTQLFSCSIPDSWLILQPTLRAVAPMPTFKLGALAFGRFWCANFDDDPGALMGSYPNQYGTMDPLTRNTPDPRGAGITALHTVGGALLLFTETSTFIMTPSDDGVGYKTSTLHPNVGCVAPNSVQTLPNGVTIWMSREGFHGWTGEGLPQDISQAPGGIKNLYGRVNFARRHRACSAVDPEMGEYRCWFAVDGEHRNNRCVVYMGEGWAERTDCSADAVCVKQNASQQMLAAGLATVYDARDEQEKDVNSLWVLDHEAPGVQTAVRADCLVSTAWMRQTRSQRRGNVLFLTAFLRESDESSLSVDMLRGWRDFPSTAKEPQPNYDTADPAPRFDLTTLGGTDYNKGTSGYEKSLFLTRRPFWSKIDCELHSVETVRFTFKGSNFELLGFEFADQDSHGGGQRMPEATR